MSNNPPLRYSHNHHLLAVKGCESALDVLAFEGDEALSTPFRYRIEFTSSDHAIAREAMLMKPGSLTLQAPVDQGYGIKVQQAVRTIQGVVTGFERLSTSKDETRYALTLRPRLALLDRSHQNAILPGHVGSANRGKNPARAPRYARSGFSVLAVKRIPAP